MNALCLRLVAVIGILLASTLVAAERDDQIDPQPDPEGGLKLRLICGNHATDAKLARLPSFPDIQSVEAFGSAGFSDAGLVHIAALPKLRKLALGGLHLTPEGLDSLRGKASLTTLTIMQTPLTPELAEIIASLPNLEVLRLRPKTIEPGAWKPLTKMARLRELDLSNSLADAHPEQLAGMEDFTQLEKVTLFSSGFGPSSLARLTGNKHLRELRLMKLPVNEEAAKSIAQLGELRSLNVHYAAVTPEALKILADSRRLRHLGIHGDELRREDLQFLKPFRQLHTLDVSGARISEADTHELRSALHNTVVNRYNWKHNVADLRSIAKHVEQNERGEVTSVTMLCHERATDAKVGILHQFPEIEELKLAGNELTDYALLEMRTIKKLRTLELNSYGVTDAGIVHLAENKDLRKIQLRTPNVTAAGVAKLKELLPNVEIIH